MPHAERRQAGVAVLGTITARAFAELVSFDDIRCRTS
jgi:hypothetical protein